MRAALSRYRDETIRDLYTCGEVECLLNPRDLYVLSACLVHGEGTTFSMNAVALFIDKQCDAWRETPRFASRARLFERVNALWRLGALYDVIPARQTRRYLETTEMANHVLGFADDRRVGPFADYAPKELKVAPETLKYYHYHYARAIVADHRCIPGVYFPDDPEETPVTDTRPPTFKELEVMRYIITCYERNGSVPPMQTIADAMDVTKQMISLHIKKMERYGWFAPRHPLLAKTAPRDLTPEVAAYDALKIFPARRLYGLVA